MPEPLPNDYLDLYTGANNPDLELINAPLAWSITPGGDPSVVVGIVDANISSLHEDLTGQIINNIQLGNYTLFHGTGVAGTIAAKTNNGVGIASLAYNTKLFSANTNSYTCSLIFCLNF